MDVSTVHYRVNDDKFEFNLEEEEELELFQRMVIMLIAKSGKTGAETKSKIPYEDIKIDDAVFNTDLSESTPKTIVSSDVQQLTDTKSWEKDDCSLQKRTEIIKTDHGKLQTCDNGVSEADLKIIQQIGQRRKTSVSENTKTSNNKNVTYSQDENFDNNNNKNCNGNECDCKIKDIQKTKNKKEAALENLTAVISSKPEFLGLESRIAEILGNQQELALKSANNTENKAEAIISDNFDDSQISNKVGDLTVMDAQSPKNSLNCKKSNHVTYTVPTRKCKVKKSRPKINEINTNTTTNNISKTHILSKQPKTNQNAFDVTTASESSKKKIKSRSNMRLQNISKIPTLVKPVTPAPTKSIRKFATSATSETYNSTVREANNKNTLVQSTANLEEPNSTNNQSKVLNTTSKAKTNSSLNTKKSGKILSACAKRKLYAESLRNKKINLKNEPTLTSITYPEKGANEDCMYCYPNDVRAGSSEQQLKKEVSPSRLPLPKFASRHNNTCILQQPEVKLDSSESYVYSLRSVLEDRQDANTDHQKPGCFLCSKRRCSPNDSMCVIEDDGDDVEILPFLFTNKRPSNYPTIPASNKPSCSGMNLKQNAQHKFAPDESTKLLNEEGHTYHAYSVVADYPNVTDVFRSKFKAKSSISLFSRKSTFSCDNILPCVSHGYFASNCSLNTIRSKTLYSSKSSSLLNTNCSDEIHNPYEGTKHLNSYGRIVRGPRLRKRNSMGKNNANMNFCSPSIEFFSTIEQNSSTDNKNMSANSPLNPTSSYEFRHSTPNYVHKDVKSVESAEEKIPFYSRSARIPRRKVSLLEACQYLRDSSLSDNCCNDGKTYTHEEHEGANIASNSSHRNNYYTKNEEVFSDKLLEKKYKNVNRKTFFNDIKSLIYQSLDRTSNTLGSLSRKSDTPYSNVLNQQHRECMMSNLPNSNYSESDLTVPYLELNAVETYFEEPRHSKRNKNKNENSKVNNIQNIAAKGRNAAMVKIAKTTKYDTAQNRNLKLHSSRDPSYNTKKSEDQHKIKSPTLKRRRYDQYNVIEDEEQYATGNIPSSLRARERYSKKKNKRCCENSENTFSSAKDEEELYTIFKLEDDQIHRQRKKSLEKNQSEECFKMFAYNNIIELDVDYPLLYSTCMYNKYMNKPFLYGTGEKSKLFSQAHEYKKERLKCSKKEDTFFSAPITPTSDKTESGYGSCKSKTSLRNFFLQQQNVLDAFTSPFNCFDQEVYGGKSNPMSIVTTFPVNTSTYSNYCSQPQNASYCADYDSQPNSSQKRRRTLLKDDTSDSSDSSNDTYTYNQSSSSKFKNNCSSRHDRLSSQLYNVGVERSDRCCERQKRVDATNNQNKKPHKYVSMCNQRSSAKYEVGMDQPPFYSTNSKPPNSKFHCHEQHEQYKSNNDNFSNKPHKSRIPQKIKPRANQCPNKPEELEEQFFVCDKHKPLLFLKQKLRKGHERKGNKTIGSANRFIVEEEQAFSSNYRHIPSTSIKQKLSETHKYKEAEEYDVSEYLSPQRQLNDIWQIHNNKSIQKSRRRYKGLCSEQTDVWHSDSKEFVNRTGGRFKNLIRSISRPFHISRKLDEDFSAADEHSSSCTISTNDSGSNQKYVWFRNNKNLNANTNVLSQSKTSLRDIAVGMSQIYCDKPQNSTCLQKQVDQCHEYANKVCTESRLREQGRLKQFNDFKEIPLSILLGKKPSQPTESVKTSLNSSKSANRSKKLLPKLKVLDDAQLSKEVLELNSLCEDKEDKISKHKCSSILEKNYFYDEFIKNLDDKILESKPINKSEEYTKETCKTLKNLLLNSECAKETSKDFRNFLSKSECTEVTYNDLRNAFKESECTEETCKKLRKLVKELRETFLEGTEGTSVNLKNILKESIIPLKELLEMMLQKLFDVPTKCEPSNELSMRLPSGTSLTTSSQHSLKELLEVPYHESTQVTRKTLSEDSIVSLKKLLDRVFDELLSTASKNSSVSSKLSTDFTKSPIGESSHVSLENTKEFSASERTVSSTLIDPVNVPLIKLAESAGTTSLNKSLKLSAMESADITKKSKKRLSTELSDLSSKEILAQSVVSQIEKLFKHLSQHKSEKLLELFKESLDTPVKEVQVNVIKPPPKAPIRECLRDFYPEYTQTKFRNLKNFSKESKELLQVTVQKILSRSMENIDSVETNSILEKSSKHSVKEPLQFSTSKSKAVTSKDLKKLTNKTVATSMKDSNEEPYTNSAKTNTIGVKCLSKESKEILGYIFQKLSPVNNPEKYFRTAIPELSSSDYSETRNSNVKEFFEESGKMPTTEAFLRVVKSSEISLNTSTRKSSSLRIESKDTSEQFKQELESELSRNISSPTQILLREILQYYVEVPPNLPFSNCEKSTNTQNKNTCSEEHNKPSKEKLTETFKAPPETLIMSFTNEPLSVSSTEIVEKEMSVKESLEHLFIESSQHKLSCACKYLKDVLKEPSATTPKEAIMQILKSLAENLSKESREDLYSNIQNLFTKFEVKSPAAVFSSQHIVKKPSECIKSLKKYVKKSSEESLDLSIKEASIQISKSPESVAAPTEAILKQLQEDFVEKPIKVPFLGCTKATCETFKRIPNQPADELQKNVAIQVIKTETLIEESVKEPLISPRLQCTKSTCTTKRSIDLAQKAISVLSNTSSSRSLKNASNDLPKKSNKMLEGEFQKIINLSEESVSSKEVLQGTSDPSGEVGVSEKVLPKDVLLKESPQDSVKASSNLSFTEGTETTCKDCAGMLSEEVLLRVVNLEPQTSIKSKPSNEITVTPTTLKSLSETSLKQKSQNTFETPQKADFWECTKSTCPHLKRMSKESVDSTRKSLFSKEFITESSSNSSGTMAKSIRSLSEQAQELLREVFKKSAPPSKEMLEETFVKLLNLSNETIALENVIPSMEVILNETTPNAVEQHSECTPKISKATDILSSKEECTRDLKSPSTLTRIESGKDTSDTNSTSLKSSPNEIPLKLSAESSAQEPFKLQISSCTKATCKYLNGASSDLPPKEVTVQVAESFLSSTIESVKETSDTNSASLKNSFKETKKTVKEIPLMLADESSAQECTKATCRYLKGASKASSDLPPKDVSVQTSESLLSSVKDTSDINSASMKSSSKELKTTVKETPLKLSADSSVQESPKLQVLECTEETCKCLNEGSTASSDLPPKEVSVQVLEPLLPSTTEFVKDISDINSASMKNSSKELKTTVKETTLKLSADSSVQESPKLQVLECTEETCKYLNEGSTASSDLPPKEASVQVLEPLLPSTTEFVKDTADNAFTRLLSLPSESKETLQDILFKESVEPSIDKPPKLPPSECTELKETSKYSVGTPPKEELSNCTYKICEYLRNLSEESRELLESTFQNLVELSKQSPKNALSVLPEEQQKITEFPEKVSNKPSQDAPKESAKLPSSECTCGIPRSKSACNHLIDLSEEPRKLSDTTLQPSTDASNNVQSNCLQKVMSMELLQPKEPSYSSVQSKELSQLQTSKISTTSTKMQEISLQNSVTVLKQSSSVQSKDTSQLNELSLKAALIESPQSPDLGCTYKESTPKCTCKSAANASKQSANEESRLLPQVIESKSETTPTCSCPNLISFSEDSRELLEMSLQNSATTPQQPANEELKDPPQDALLNNSLSEGTFKNVTRLSQESVELSNTIFQNFAKSSEDCFTAQINEQPHIVESFSETESKGLFEDSVKESLDISKYFFKNFENFPKESEKLLVAFQAILNMSKEPKCMLEKKETPKKLNSSQTQMCRQCNPAPGIDSYSEVPEELMKQLCNASLKTMMKLYDKVSDNKETKLSFKAMVEELYKNKSKEKKTSDIETQSQLNIINLLQKYIDEDDALAKAQENCACLQNKEETNILGKEEKKIIKTGPALNTERDKFTSPIKDKEKNEYSSLQIKKEKQSASASIEKAEVADSQEREICAVDNVSEHVASTFATFKTDCRVSIKSQERFTDLKFVNKSNKKEDTLGKTAKKNPLRELRDSLTDKELFEKLLDSYEKEENIVERLSNDGEFFQSQLELVKSKNSIESLIKDKEKITSKSEEQLLALLNLGSFSGLLKDEEKKKSSNTAFYPENAESLELPQKKQSKSKISGLKSRVARLFKSDDVKEIVAPRSDSYKNSVDVSYYDSKTEVDERAALINKSISSENLTTSESTQKVKFIGGQRFLEEKKLLGEGTETFLTEAHQNGGKRKSSADSDSDVVKPTELGKCFLRGFRSDYVSLGGDTCLLISNQEKEQQGLRGEAYIEFSERNSPLEYLLALGFSIDEASNAIKDEDVKNRLLAAITEARIWINKISTLQGTLLYLIAYKAKPRIMRYYLQLVEAIINRRIQNAVKLDAFLRVLEKVEDGDLNMVNIIGADKFDDEENEEKKVKKQLRELFIDVYKTAENEATLKNKPLSKEAVILLRILAAKYRAGLHPHLKLIARYIGQGLLRNEVQLEAAMIYLSRLDTADVNLEEFEQYCGIVCKKNKTPDSDTKAN